MKTPLLTIKNYQSCKGGPEGDPFSCVLYVDGKRAALVSDDGWGGGYRYDWSIGKGGTFHGGPLHDAVMAHVAQLPAIEENGKIFPADLDCIIAELVDFLVWRRKFARLCKRRTLFRRPTDPLDQWNEIASPFTPELAQRMRAKFGADIVFANVQFGFAKEETPHA